MNSRLVPSPAFVIATGRRGLKFGKARTVLIGSGLVSMPSAAGDRVGVDSAAARRPKTRTQKWVSGVNLMIKKGGREKTVAARARPQGTDIIASHERPGHCPQLPSGWGV